MAPMRWHQKHKLCLSRTPCRGARHHQATGSALMASMPDESGDARLLEILHMLTATELRTAIRSAIFSGGDEVRIPIEAAAFAQLDARSHAASAVSSIEREVAAGQPLTPLYSMLDDDYADDVGNGGGGGGSGGGGVAVARAAATNGHAGSKAAGSLNIARRNGTGGSAPPSSPGQSARPAVQANAGGAGAHRNGNDGAATAPHGAPRNGQSRRAIPPGPVGPAPMGGRDDALAREWHGGFIFFSRHDTFQASHQPAPLPLPVPSRHACIRAGEL